MDGSFPVSKVVGLGDVEAGQAVGNGSTLDVMFMKDVVLQLPWCAGADELASEVSVVMARSPLLACYTVCPMTESAG